MFLMTKVEETELREPLLLYMFNIEPKSRDVAKPKRTDNDGPGYTFSSSFGILYKTFILKNYHEQTPTFTDL